MAKEAAEKTKEAEEKTQQDLLGLSDEIDILVNGTKDPTKEIVADGSFDGTINTPKLGAGMKAITWDEKHQNDDGTKGAWVEPKTNTEWYNYAEQKWANATTEKEGVISYWVWIPRYAYRITSGYHQNGTEINPDNPQNGAGTVEIKFLKGRTNKYEENGQEKVVMPLTESQINNSNENKGPTADQTLVVHPAFQNGSKTNYSNGEWNAEITGIWVAKFEASHSDAEMITKDTVSPIAGNSMKLSVRPNVETWGNITTGDSFTTCKEYDTLLNSHLMKDSEWGAVAYLTHSIYGKNSEVAVNECQGRIAGAGPIIGSDVFNGVYAYDKNIFLTTYSYITAQGQKASTTGNVFGIYDMSGGCWEIMAAYVDYGSENAQIKEYGGELYSTKDLWMKNVYTKGNGNIDSQEVNYEENKNIYGNAIWETSNRTENGLSWYEDVFSFPSETDPFMIRGGYHKGGSRCGTFRFNGDTGHPDLCHSFRPILIVT